MSGDVAFPTPTGLQPFAEKARSYAEQARSANTRRAYASDVRAFGAWCTARNVRALPADPAAVLSYLIDHATTLKVATLQRRLAAIREQHASAGFVLETSSAASSTPGRASNASTADRPGRSEH